MNKDIKDLVELYRLGQPYLSWDENRKCFFDLWNTQDFPNNRKAEKAAYNPSIAKAGRSDTFRYCNEIGASGVSMPFFDDAPFYGRASG